MSYSSADPSTWSGFAASKASSSVSTSECTPTTARSFWRASGPKRPMQSVVVDNKQFRLGLPLEDVADEVAEAARDNRAIVVFDATNKAPLPESSRLASPARRSTG